MTEDRIDELEARLRRAHRSVVAPAATPAWSEGVLDAVRASELDSDVAPARAISLLVRNAFLVSAAAALLTALLVPVRGFGARIELVEAFARDPQALFEWVLLF